MKNSLVQLIFEEYKQNCLFSDLEKRGISMANMAVNNFDIVLDLIGFPEDNTVDYDFYALDGQPHDPANGLAPDDNFFCRDWLYDQYFEITNSIDKIQKIEVTDKGLKMTEYDDEKLIKAKLRNLVDWLYMEYDHLK